MKDLRNLAIKGAIWNYSINFVSAFIQPLTILIVARFLSPEHFGIFGMSILVIRFVIYIQDIGTGYALIQRKQFSETNTNTAFLNIAALGILWFFLIFFIAPFIANYFKNYDLILAIRVLAIYFLLNPLSFIQRKIFERELKFKNLFFLRALSLIFSAVVAISLVIMKFDFWALIFGFLAEPFILAIVIWKFSSWRPRLLYDLKLSKRMFSFGGLATAALLLGWLINFVDHVFVGRFLGERQLGIYQLGGRLGLFLFFYAAAPLCRVFYSTFCKIQEDKLSLKNYYLGYIRLVSTLVIPVCALIYFIAPLAIKLFLEFRWHPTIRIIQLFSIFSIFLSFVAVNPELLRAVGRQKVLLKILVARIVFTVPLLYFFAQRSIIEVCYVHIVVSAIFLPINLLILHKILRWKVYELLNVLKSSIVIILALVFTNTLFQRQIFGLNFMHDNNLLKLFTLSTFLVITYFILLIRLEKQYFRELLVFLKDIFSNANR
ncbi:lipopolysaccharide biosynthesis protein [Candidatus Omnitrophota bacterium]